MKFRYSKKFPQKICGLLLGPISLQVHDITRFLSHDNNQQMRDQLLSTLSQEDSQAIVQVANERRRLAAGETDTQALEATTTLNDSDMQRGIAEH